MEKGAFWLRLSAPEVECEERMHQAEGTACARHLRWEDDYPFKEQKKANVTGGLSRRGRVSGSRWLKDTHGSKQKDPIP